MDYTFRPIQQWPRPFTKSRKRSPFGATYAKTFADLDRELSHVHARNPIIQLALSESEIRRDGKPRAHASPSHPGVIVTFEKGKTTLNFPCDAFTDWLSNLRAVGLALEALRRIDRYGVTSNAEQYRGWSQLPPAEPADAAKAAAEALSTLAYGSTVNAEKIRTIAEAFSTAYRSAAKLLHPDANGGREDQAWHRLQAAAGVLSKHHGVA